MTYLYAPLAGLIVLLLNIIAPLLVLLAMPFVHWDSEPSVGPRRTHDPVPTIMGDFPAWLSWLRTPDQRLPGDTGIPEVRDMLDRYGKWVTAWWWAGMRNALMGLSCWLGKQTSDYLPEEVDGYWERRDQYGHIWKYVLPLGPVKIITGYSVYALLDDRFWAAPVLTVKWRK